MTIDIEKLAGQPKKASSDAGSVEAQTLKDQIEADKYLRARAAAKPASLVASVQIENGSAF